MEKGYMWLAEKSGKLKGGEMLRKRRHLLRKIKQESK
jgi:hypothetical protein